MKRLRKLLFWTHLVIGLAAGVTIGVAVFTGACMAFEKQVIAWAERDLRRVTPPGPDAPRMPLDEILASIRKSQPQAQLASVVVASDPAAAIVFGFGRTNTVYVDPYTGDIQPQGAPRLRAFFQMMLRWHRWLGVSAPPPGPRAATAGSGVSVEGRDGAGASRAGGAEPRGSGTPGTPAGDAGPTGERREGPGGLREFMGTVMGVSAAIFGTLALSGLYLWWPRSLTRKAFRLASVPNLRLRGKVRDWNWHNALGFWAAPWIVIMSLTGMVMAFRPFGNVLYGPGGPGPGQGGGTNQPVLYTAPEPGVRPLGLDALLAKATGEVPHWETVTLRLGGRGGRGGPGMAGGAGGRPGGTGRGDAESGARLNEGSQDGAVSPRSREVSSAERAGETGRSGAASGEGGPRSGGAGRGGRGTAAVSIAVHEEGSWFPRPIQIQVQPFTGEILQRTTFGSQVAEHGLRRALRGLNRTVHTGEAGGLLGQTLALFVCVAGMVLVYTGFALSWRRFFKRKAIAAPDPSTPSPG